MHLKKLIRCLLFVLLSGMVSCKAYTPVANRATVTQAPRYAPLENYIQKYGDLAVSEMKRTGVPASITLAQGMLESDYGRSYLAREANNHFGIKCGGNWKGEKSTHTDNKRNECFRKYGNAEESFRDHSEFLRNGTRYRTLFDLDPADYKGWAHGLSRAGYATNPQYASLLIKKIEENSLWQYDTGNNIARTTPPEQAKIKESNALNVRMENDFPRPSPGITAKSPRILENNRIQYIIVKDGETKEELERNFSLLKWELAKYNELEKNFTPVTGQILYLQPKRDRAEAGKTSHKAEQGETMYMISQKYGIKLKSLYEMNRMDNGTEPAPGSIIYLRGTRPVN